MMEMIMLRRVYGDDAATAAVVRDILAPVASQLSSPEDLHRRCVLVEHLRAGTGPEDARAAFAPLGEVEAAAICTCAFLRKAVVVFAAAADAARALQKQQGKTRIGCCRPVPPLASAPNYRILGSSQIQAVGRGGDRVPTPPEEEEPSGEARAQAFRELCERKPMIVFDDDPEGEACAGGGATRQFAPSVDSLVHGPTLGGDGHLWMHGTMNTSHAPCGLRVERVSIRVAQEMAGPRKMRVTPLRPYSYVLQQQEG